MEHVGTIAEALDRMAEIGVLVEFDPDDPGPPGSQDGLVCFNHLYTKVTKRVDDLVNEGGFGDGKFMTALDVAFANRYFEAIAAWEARRVDDLPRVWGVLLDRRDVPDIASIQFAAAGVNAHINLDLAIALVHTCNQLGVPLGAGDQRAEYEKINEIFGDLFAIFRAEFTQGRYEHIDQGKVERHLDRVSHFVVDKARDVAWESAEEIFEQMERSKRRADRFTNRLDTIFGFAARGLLIR